MCEQEKPLSEQLTFLANTYEILERHVLADRLFRQADRATELEAELVICERAREILAWRWIVEPGEDPVVELERTLQQAREEADRDDCTNDGI